MINCLLSASSVRESFKLKAYKGWRQKLEHYREIVYHRGWDGDNSLVSQDSNDWWVFGDVSGGSHWGNHLMGRSSSMLFWFPGIRLVSIPPCMVTKGSADP